MSKNIFENILWILCIISKFGLIRGQKAEIIDCKNEELVTSIFNEPIDLTLRGIIKIYENVTINEIRNTTNNEFDVNYIDARLENSTQNGTKNLVLFVTEQFENYAQEQTAARISLKINMGCGQGRERVVIFFQPLKEGNYFSPIFSQTHYEMFIPTPIFAGFDLTAFLEITAKDDDLTHNQLNFTSNDSSLYHISVTTKNVTKADKKTYFASIILQTNLLELPQPMQFKITASDNGTPSKSTNASITIRADPKRQLPITPKFTQNVYRGLINFDFSMQPLEIELVNGTYSPQIIFSLQGSNIKGFHLQDYRNGVLNVTWSSENLNRSEILRQAIWELELRAEHVKLAEFGRATVIVELADFQNNFRFMSSYYEGYIDELSELHIDPIIFNPYTYKRDMTFELLTSHNQFFNLSIRNYRVQLQLSTNFTWQSIDDMSFLKLILKASWESLSSATNVLIKLPEIRDEVKPQMFQFEKPLYVGQLNETHGLDLETIILQTDVDDLKQNVQFSLSGNGSDAFYFTFNLNQIKIKTNFSTNVVLNEYLLVLQAKRDGRITFTSVIIKKFPIPSTTIKKIFLNSLFMGSTFYDKATNTQSFTGEPIQVQEDVREGFETLIFNLTGDYFSNFDLNVNYSTQTLDLSLKTPLPGNLLNTKTFLNLTLNAYLTTPELLNDTALIFIELPIKECPVSEPMQSGPPHFSSSEYTFTAYTNQTGLLGVINALSTDWNATIHYNIAVESDLLAQRLSISPFNGELFLYGTLDEGNYPFNITAENVKTRERTNVKALLKVQPQEECKPFQGMTVEKTIIIRHVEEERPFYGLMDLKFNQNCTLRIENMWPNDKEYVHVNYIFNMLDAIAIDREDPIFENMTEPQIMVKLRLKCDEEELEHLLSIDIPEPEQHNTEFMFSDEIPFAPDVVWLFIKIDDINDNAPQFQLPSDGPLYLGYPSGIVPFEVYPEYLCKIKAFDRDLGFNAKIKFTMKENPYFGIEPSTGTIYPKANILEKDQQVELIVLAADQYGEGLISGLEVIVKGLTPDFYSLITLKDNSSRDQSEVELSLSQRTGFDIKVLKMSYVPQLIRQRAQDNASLCCKAWIYGYQKQELVPFKDMQEQILVQNTVSNIVNMESYEEAAYRYTPAKDTHNGYFIATIILSLITCSSIVFISWRFCYKSTASLKADKNPTTPHIENYKNGNVKQISTTCSHDSVEAANCLECHKTNDVASNCVKFSEHIADVIVEKSQLN